MKRLTTAMFAAGSAVLMGCSQGTPGGPGAAKPTDAPVTSTPTVGKTVKLVVGQAEETFVLSVPILATKLQQGQSQSAMISLTRGKNFDEDVTLKFDNMPKGVTIQPTSPVIKHGDAEARITFQAADNAALGDFTVNVTGQPTKGADAKSEFKLTLAAK